MHTMLAWPLAVSCSQVGSRSWSPALAKHTHRLAWGWLGWQLQASWQPQLAQHYTWPLWFVHSCLSSLSTTMVPESHNAVHTNVNSGCPIGTGKYTLGLDSSFFLIVLMSRAWTGGAMSMICHGRHSPALGGPGSINYYNTCLAACAV